MLEFVETCESAALCNEAAGACTEMVCTPDKVTCADDGTLQTCNADGSENLSTEMCGQDMCDAQAGRCFTCLPNSRQCAGDMVATCSSDGQMLMMEGCSFPNAVTGCSDGACAIRSCQRNFDDCNGNANDGCETELSRDVANCGTCGSRCDTKQNAGPPQCSGGRCVYECDDGYTGSDCRPVDCGAPPIPANGRVSTSSGTQFNDSASYSCNDGYKIEGSPSRTCQANGSWSGSAPTCVAQAMCGNGRVEEGEECDSTNEFACEDCERRSRYIVCSRASDCVESNSTCEAGRCLMTCSGGETCFDWFGEQGVCLNARCFRMCQTGSCPNGMTCTQGGVAPICQ
jgi:hypothetical protein